MYGIIYNLHNIYKIRHAEITLDIQSHNRLSHSTKLNQHCTRDSGDTHTFNLAEGGGNLEGICCKVVKKIDSIPPMVHANSWQPEWHTSRHRVKSVTTPRLRLVVFAAARMLIVFMPQRNNKKRPHCCSSTWSKNMTHGEKQKGEGKRGEQTGRRWRGERWSSFAKCTKFAFLCTDKWESGT